MYMYVYVYMYKKVCVELNLKVLNLKKDVFYEQNEIYEYPC
jgi:hypothetical protein